MRSVVEIDPAWLYEIAPHFYSLADLKLKDKTEEAPQPQ